jgi:predicted ATP-grasp superfamily ATP-dependent carboligase
VRLFVSEYLCGGARPGPDLPPSLAREGRAMLLALLTDLAQLPEVTVCTTWDSRLGPFPVNAPNAVACGSPLNVEVATIRDQRVEADVFRRLAAESDATYVIAPELGDLLTQRCRAVVDAGGRSLNVSLDATAACSDKWETFVRLSSGDVPTVPTAQFDPRTRPFPYPVVVKPRYGAGSQDTFLVRDSSELQVAAACFPGDSPTSQAVIQPFVAGRSLSLAAIFRSDGSLRELWPVGEQMLSADGRFTYHGGRIPASFHPRSHSLMISKLISRIPTLIGGLRGYVGCDLIVPNESGTTPLIVDINPRLTTSYLGYRALTSDNLAARILDPDADVAPVNWNAAPIEFQSDGSINTSR